MQFHILIFIYKKEYNVCIVIGTIVIFINNDFILNELIILKFVNVQYLGNNKK